MSKPQNRQASIDSRRIELEREIVIRLPAFDTFVTEYSTNISTTGMFVASDNPRPPGTSFAFEFRVADDWKLIRGKGQVVWARYSSEGQSRPPGMGIRHTELDGQSRRLIRWIVEKHIREGGTPFELDDFRSDIDRALERAVEDDETPAPAPMARARPPEESQAASGPPWRLVLLLLSATALVALIAAILWISEPTQPREIPAAATASAPAPTASTAVPPAAEAPPEPDPAAVPALVTSWSRDWAAQRPDRYLAHYATAFEPPNGLSRGEWEAVRRERLTTPESITIGITSLESNELGPRRAEAVFTQSYRSDLLEDVVRKRLELVWEADAWKIAAEEVVGILE